LNIFYLDSDPALAAKFHVDRHVTKMVTEYAQILSTAHRLIDGNQQVIQSVSRKTGKTRKKKVWIIDDDRDGVLYSATHINHPSAKWARASVQHYVWLYRLFDNLHKEYQHRYGSHKIHKTYARLSHHLKTPPLKLADNGWEDPYQAMPDDIQTGSSLTDYRMYYIRDKKRMHKWTKRNPPSWLHTPISNTDMETKHEINRLSNEPGSIRGS